MGRHHRDLTRSDWYHVYNRGADKQDIFSGDCDRSLFVTLMAEAFDRFEISLHAFALMSNHFHTLVHAPAGLSEAMQRLCGRYGAAYNQRTGRSGSLFTGRFCSEPITSDAQLTWSGRYIHRNPLDIVGRDGLATYRWSSLGYLLGVWPVPAWLSADTLLPASHRSSTSYLEFVLAPHPSDRVGQGELPALTNTTLEEIDIAVDTVLSVSPGVSPMRPADLRRLLAVTVAVETRAADTSRLATSYGLSDRSSVRRLARRGRVHAVESATFAALHDGVLAQLVHR
jgi:REP element-mobilizing transposase RayT